MTQNTHPQPMKRKPIRPHLALFVCFLMLGASLAAQKPRIFKALEHAATNALVLRGSCETVLQSTDDEGELVREADASEWKGAVELLRAKNGQILLASAAPDGAKDGADKTGFAILMAGETRLVEARFGARRVALGAFARAMPRLLDWSHLRKWLQRAAARGRLAATKDPEHKDGRRYRIRLPARAVMPTPEEDDEDEEEEDEEHEPAARQMLVHVDLVLRISAQDRVRALRIELHETAPLLALQRAWKRAVDKVEGEQTPRIPVRGETMRELEDELRRVRVLDLEVVEKEGEATRAALERMVPRLR